jgi:hypothetical protein
VDRASSCRPLRRDPSDGTYHGCRDAAPSRDALTDLRPSSLSLSSALAKVKSTGAGQDFGEGHQGGDFREEI